MATVALGAGFLIPNLATASTVDNFAFSTTYSDGTNAGDTLTGTISLDISGGLADAGTLTIAGAGLPGTETLGLVVPASNVYEAGDGTKLSGSDNNFPITSNGMTFGTNAPGSLNGGYTVQFLLGGEFGECASNVVCGFIAGPGGPTNLYDKLGPTTITPVPEPSTWAMMILGFCRNRLHGLSAKEHRRSALRLIAVT